MLYLTCTTITNVDLADDGVYRAKDWVSVDCGTKYYCQDEAHLLTFISIYSVALWKMV